MATTYKLVELIYLGWIKINPYGGYLTTWMFVGTQIKEGAWSILEWSRRKLN